MREKKISAFILTDNSDKIIKTKQGDNGTIVAVCLVFVIQLGEPLPIPCSSSEAVGAHKTLQGDRIRRKMRKIIGRSDLIMANPVKNKLLIGIRPFGEF